MSRWSGYLTIIPQAHEHDEVVVVGAPEALRHLALRILRAADSAEDLPEGLAGVARTDLMDPGDGEGYRVYVVPVETPEKGTRAPIQPWYNAPRTPWIGWDDWERWYEAEIVPRVRAAREAAGHE